MYLILLSLAILPVAVILYIIYKNDDDKEPMGLLIKSFIFGALSAIPVIFLETFLSNFDPGTPLLSGLFNGYIVAGFSEELFKLATFYLIVWRSKEFDEYYDGIVYAVFISMGFACLENIGYVFNSDSLANSMTTAIVRAAVSVPGHFLFAVAMGYYLALAKFDIKNRRLNRWLALIVPMLLHGTFDAILMVGDDLSSSPELEYFIGALEFVTFIIFDVRLWRHGMRRIRKMQELSRMSDFNPNDPFRGFKWNI